MSAIVNPGSIANRGPAASSRPSSWISDWPSQARSVLLSPGPAAENT